jgi:hypothetical protein
MTSGVRNVLEAIVEQTTYRSGPRKGKAKQALDCSHFYISPIRKLETAGLIRFVDNNLGYGYVATEAGVARARQ